MLRLKNEFIERFQRLLGDEADLFFRYCELPLKQSIRVNTLKIDKLELVKRLEEKGWELKGVKWYEHALIVERAPLSLGNAIEHFLGYFYVQELASMLPPLAMELEPGQIVLDMCAAPGSKATQIAQLMEGRGVVIANDIRIDRIKALVANLQRCGAANAIVTRMPGQKFAKVEQKFDRVLVDAPCSSEGAIRKDWDIMRMWNVRNVLNLSRLQKKLIEAGFECLKEGGILVYSTCTLAPEENEEVIDYLLKRFDNAELRRIRIRNFKHRDGILEWRGKKYESEVKHCWRIYPQDNDTEGFFLAKVRKA